MNSTATTAHAAAVEALHDAAAAIRRGGYAVPRRVETLDEARAWTIALYPTTVGTPAVVTRFAYGLANADAELEAVARHLDEALAPALDTIKGRTYGVPSPDPVEAAALAGDEYLRTVAILAVIRAELGRRVAICWPH